tara:strand:- start:3171 stop:3557 length:387 start_codon:yes stop_codon:yes gene_type:complete
MALAEVSNIQKEDASQEKAKQLPQPTGYHILVGLPNIDEKTDGGILKTVDSVKSEEVSSIVGFVIKLGQECYSDSKRFPNGPWCKEGDFIIMRPYSGTRMMIHGKEFRLINDDTVEAVVEDPRGVGRV